MTKFNPENKAKLTYEECLGPAMGITDPEDAKQYLASYIQFQQSLMHGSNGERTAEEICKINLGYFAGYCSDETRERVERLFVTVHPVFGKFTHNKTVTGEDAFKLGVSEGEK